METRKRVKNANSLYREFCGSDNFYRRKMTGIIYTDGVGQVAEDCGAYWFIDVVASYRNHVKYLKKNSRHGSSNELAETGF